MKFDDPVTYLDDTLLVHARWGRLTVHGARKDEHVLYRHGMAGHVFLSYVLLADEGITWVRGHVSEKDEIGRALLAYGALTARPKTFQELFEEHNVVLTDEDLVKAIR